MSDSLSLDLVDKHLVCDQIILNIGYDTECLSNGRKYSGAVVNDYYGRAVPKSAHGSINLSNPSSSTEEIISHAAALFEKIVDKNPLVRRMNIVANHTIAQDEVPGIQLDLFEQKPVCNEKEKKRHPQGYQL